MIVKIHNKILTLSCNWHVRNDRAPEIFVVLVMITRYMAHPALEGKGFGDKGKTT
jgi:hypothetical protein